MSRQNDTSKAATESAGAKVLNFDLSRKLRNSEAASDESDRVVAAVVTVTRFIGGEKVHAQVAVFADQVIPDSDEAPDFRLIPELSERLADGAVEANAYLDRRANTMAAKPLHEFYPQ